MDELERLRQELRKARQELAVQHELLKKQERRRSPTEAGRAAPVRTRFDMAALARQMLKGHEPMASKKKILLVGSIPPAADLIWGEMEKVAHLLTNLLDNAIQYTPDGGRVTLSLITSEAGVRVEVADTGPGIDPKFFANPEAGLGLSIAKDIVALHRGQIGLESGKGQGSRFFFLLPRDLRA